MTEKELKMEELMAEMNSAGLGSGMSMYDRNDMEKMMTDEYGYGDYGDEDDYYRGMGGMMGGGIPSDAYNYDSEVSDEF